MNKQLSFAQFEREVSVERLRGKIVASKRRVQQMIDLAFLAPDIIRSVLNGKQPTGFTTEWCKTHTLPADWTEQRAIIATL